MSDALSSKAWPSRPSAGSPCVWSGWAATAMQTGVCGGGVAPLTGPPQGVCRAHTPDSHPRRGHTPFVHRWMIDYWDTMMMMSV